MTPRQLLARGIYACLPPRWRLPYRVALARLRGQLESEVRVLARLAGNRRRALDIGANVGYYTYFLARIYSAVEAFEPNPEVTDAIRACGRDHVRCHHVALSDQAGAAELHIPVIAGREDPAWASLHAENCPARDEMRVITVETRRLDDFGFTDVDLMKVDAEGHEVAVLRGARETLVRCRPALILEVRPHNRATVAEFLQPLGYSPCVVDRTALKPLGVSLANYNGDAETFVFPAPHRM